MPKKKEREQNETQLEKRQDEALCRCCTRFYTDGCDSERCRGRSRADWHQERGPGAWSIRRWLRLGSRRQDPREGWLHGIGGAAPRDLVRRRPKVHEGRH